jgi:hypothetical protein
MDKLTKHWTQRSTEDFVYRISSDFVVQLEKRLEQLGINHKNFAKVLKLSEGRVSQVLNNPGNFTLNSTVEYARAAKMKVAIVAYDDADPDNDTGPINSGIFYACWKRAGSPRNFFALRADVSKIQQIDPYPDTSGNVGLFPLRQPFPTETAGTYCNERLQ